MNSVLCHLFIPTPSCMTYSIVVSYRQTCPNLDLFNHSQTDFTIHLINLTTTSWPTETPPPPNLLNCILLVHVLHVYYICAACVIYVWWFLCNTCVIHTHVIHVQNTCNTYVTHVIQEYSLYMCRTTLCKTGVNLTLVLHLQK